MEENNTAANKLSSSEASAIILTFCAISALLIYLIYSKNIVFGSEIGNWAYPYFKSVIAIPIWIPVTVLLLTGLIIYGGSRLMSYHEGLTLTGCFIAAVLIQILLQNISPYQLGRVIESTGSNSFYTAAKQYSPAAVLSQLHTLASSFPLHARSNMPGKILFFQLLLIFTSSTQVMGYLIIAISTLAGILLYGVCKRLFNDKILALYAFLLYALIPCKLVFFPILNTVTPVFILVCLYLFLIYFDTKNKLYLILLGISLYLLILFEPLPLVTGILFIGVLLHAIGQKKVTWKELMHILLIPTLAFAAAYLIFMLFFSFNLGQTFLSLAKDAVDFNSQEKRSYRIWIKENVKEFFYGAGLPTMMIFTYLVIKTFSQWKNFKVNILQWSAENTYLVSLLLTFSAVLFLGINRGEITRLWIFLAVFFQVPASFFMARVVKSNTLFFILAGTLIAQSMITLQHVSFVGY